MKNIVLIGEPGSGKTVLVETLPGGTIDFNFDQGGWKSLDRQAPSSKRKPKRILHSQTLRSWFEKKERLMKDQILIIDYSMYAPTMMNTGMLTNFDPKVYFDFGMDINHLEKNVEEYKQRGVCHFVADSLTGLQWYVLHGVVNLAGHAAKGTSQYTYGLAIEKMREIIDVCCQIPLDFILTSHVESEKDELVGKVNETILLYGKKLPGIILSMIDDIYYTSQMMGAGGKEFWLETAPQMFLRIIRQRSFDDLPIKLKPNFSELYKEKLVQPAEVPV